MFGKNTNQRRSPTLKQFELFLKKRNEKSSILRVTYIPIKSQTESVDSKVKCFEELIRLNRKGNSVNLTSCPPEVLLKCSSTNNIVTNQPEVFVENEQENAQHCFGKLNKMALELKSWEVSKHNSKHNLSIKESVKQSKTPQQKQSIKKSKSDAKVKKYQSNSTNSSRVKGQQTQKDKKDSWFVNTDKKAGCFPIRKKNRTLLTKRQLNTKHINQSTPNLNIDIQQKEFNGLKRKIDQLQNKAKESYGINFGMMKNQSEPNQFQVEEIEPERKDIKTAFERSRAKRNEQNNYLSLMKHHTKEDSSIPVDFMGIIRSKEQYRPVPNQIWRKYIRL